MVIPREFWYYYPKINDPPEDYYASTVLMVANKTALGKKKLPITARKSTDTASVVSKNVGSIDKFLVRSPIALDGSNERKKKRQMVVKEWQIPEATPSPSQFIDELTNHVDASQITDELVRPLDTSEMMSQDIGLATLSLRPAFYTNPLGIYDPNGPMEDECYDNHNDNLNRDFYFSQEYAAYSESHAIDPSLASLTQSTNLNSTAITVEELRENEVANLTQSTNLNSTTLTVEQLREDAVLTLRPHNRMVAFDTTDWDFNPAITIAMLNRDLYFYGGRICAPLYYRRGQVCLPGPAWCNNKCAFDSVLMALVVCRIVMSEDSLVCLQPGIM